MLEELTQLNLVVLSCDLDVDKVHLELLVGLDTNEQGRSSSGHDDLSREVGALEAEGERSLLTKPSKRKGPVRS